MKLPGLGIPMSDKIPAYLSLLFVLLLLTMSLFDFPPVLTSWEIDGKEFADEFRNGIAGIIFILIIARWIYSHRELYHQNRNDRIRLIFLFFAFYFNVLASFLILGVTSNWFAASPNSIGDNQLLYDLFKDIQFYFFISVGIIALIYILRKPQLIFKTHDSDNLKS